MQNEILNFIQRRWKKDSNWINGNCFWFAYILKTRFPHLEMYYLPIDGHFVAGDGSCYYDWNGIYIPNETPLLFSHINKIDPIWYDRIVRDCIL